MKGGHPSWFDIFVLAFGAVNRAAELRGHAVERPYPDSSSRFFMRTRL